jgi:fluoroacetyl-CoA thioesterase
MKTTLHPGLTARLDYVVPAERTGPHLLPEAAEFAALPDVLATGYLVGIIEWACMRAVNEHLGSQRSDTYLHEVGTL